MRLGRLTPERTLFLICDVQERFRPAIHKFPAIVSGSLRLLATARELSIPAIVTEQYPKGLGRTVAELDTACLAETGGGVFEKTTFSMLADAAVSGAITGAGRTSLVIAGLEAHVCVLQSVLDLVGALPDVEVHLCVDAVSSGSPTDRLTGLRRAERAGAFLTTTEAVMMELIRSKEHPSFKAISALIKASKLPASEALEPVA